MKSALDWFIHLSFIGINFGIGFFISDGVYSVLKQGFSLERTFWTLLIIATVIVASYEVTYKRHKSKLPTIKIWFVIFLVYVVPLIGGYIFWKYFG